MSRSIVAALVAALTPTLFVLGAFAESMIDHGQKAKAGQFPAVVKIGFYAQALGLEFDQGFCTGTLVAPDVVLTAAHCVQTSRQMRVSPAGQVQGLTARAGWGWIDGGGIRVKEAYSASAWIRQNKKIQAQLAFIEEKAELMAASPDYAEALWEKYRQLMTVAARSDLAFLVLEKPQAVSAPQLPKVACDLLPAGSPVINVGFGVDYGMGDARNANRDQVLHFGENRLLADVAPSELYLLDAREDAQLGNVGDSGGPLFQSETQTRLYGVASTVEQKKNSAAKYNLYTPTGSAAAIEFYHELLANPTVPSSVKKGFRHCLSPYSTEATR